MTAVLGHLGAIYHHGVVSNAIVCHGCRLPLPLN